MNNVPVKNFMTILTPWWGKSLGALLGYLVGGPAGAVLGILIGNIFDIGLFNSLYAPQWHHYRQAPKITKNVFIPALFKIMGHLAKTDGRVTEKDIHVARVIMKEMRLYGRDKRRAMRYYNEGKSVYFDFGKQLQLVQQLCYQYPQLSQIFAETQYRSCLIHGVVSIDKQKKLNQIFMALGFKPIYPDVVDQRQYQQRRSQERQTHHRQHHHKSTAGGNRSSSQDDYALLGIKRGERAAVIKRAYRKKMSQIHPDKLIAKGASQAEIEAATDKAQQIQAAYQRIRALRGF